MRGHAAGDSAASATPQMGWFARGLVAGAIAGPFGGWWTVNRAGRPTPDEIPSYGAPDENDPSFTRGYAEGYRTSERSKRREFAFAGSMVGTAVLAVVMVKAMHSRDKVGGDGTLGDGGPNLMRIPLFSWIIP